MSNTKSPKYKEYLRLNKEINDLCKRYYEIAEKQPSKYRNNHYYIGKQGAIDYSESNVEKLSDTYMSWDYTTKTKSHFYFEQIKKLFEIKSVYDYTSGIVRDIIDIDFYLRDQKIHVKYPNSQPYFREGTKINLKGIVINNATKDEPFLLRKQDFKIVYDGKEAYTELEPKYIVPPVASYWSRKHKPVEYLLDENGNKIYHEVTKYRDKHKKVYFDYWVLNIDFFVVITGKQHYEFHRYHILSDIQKAHDFLQYKQEEVARECGLYRYGRSWKKAAKAKRSRAILKQQLREIKDFNEDYDLAHKYHYPHNDKWFYD